MPAWNKPQYCKDLIRFAEVVAKYDDNGYISGGIGVLHSISSAFGYSGNDRLVIPNLTLMMHKKVAGTVPTDVSSLSINIEYCCDIDITLDRSKDDHITEYSLQLVIIGYTGGKEYTNCWHLDKDEKPQPGHTHNHTHPSYHFQAGGHKMEGIDTGEIMLLGAPRLPHPPMDIFLAIHFVLSNFYSKKDFTFIDRMFNDYDYQDIMNRARERMFVPYFSAFSAMNTHNDFKIEKVFPLAV